jgi:uncharacterized protein YndB with AHSA1/START domain
MADVAWCSQYWAGLATERIPVAIITRTQVVRKPVAEVFASVVNGGDFATWNPTIRASRRLDAGEIREGSRFEWDLRGFGKVVQELQEFERNVRVRIVPHMRQLEGGHRFRFTAQGGSTRVDHELEMNPKGAFRLFAPMMGMIGRKNLRDTARALQAYLEGPAWESAAPFFTMSQTIARPVDAVFAAAIRLDEFPAWSPRNPWARKLTPGDIGEGTRFEMGIKGFGKVTNELREFRTNERIMVVPLIKLFAGGHRWLFTRLGPSSTRIDHELEMRPKGVYKLMGPLLRANGRKTVIETAEALRRHLEAS